MIGIVGAMDIEVDGIKAEMTDKKVKTIAGLEFVSGKLDGVDVVVSRCNPGKINAAACTQIMILEYSPRLVINPGVAGGIGKGVKIGDLVVGSACVQYDVDSSPLGDPVGMVSGLNKIQFECDTKTAETVKAHAEKIYDGNVFYGIIVTGDRFVSDGEFCTKLHNDFDASACEMEGGAIAHVCYMNGVKFAVIRSISDNANDDASVDYPTFAKEAADKTIKLMNSVITEL